MIRVTGFSGEIPKTDPRLLPENAAITAKDARLDSGALEPFRSPQTAHTLSAGAWRTIYLNGASWLAWTGVVNVAKAPIAEDRIYVTGDGAPKMIVSGTTYDLALPAPTTPLTAALVSGTPDPATQYTVLYVYTYVTSFGEESEPVAASNSIVVDAALSVTLSGFATAPSGRGVTLQRIYRSQTSDAGVTTYFLIHERADTASNFTDTAGSYPIQEALPSLDYNPPPSGLSGIVTMPNGMMAAFVGKKVYFSEPYKPHAWPEKYILTVDNPIVGLGAIASNLVVMTTGTPYMMQGTAPENMTSERIEVNLPCVSAESIVDLGYMIAYASIEGLVTVDTSGARVVTSNLVTSRDWLARFAPSSFRAAQYGGRYFASYSTGGTRALLIIDLTGDQPFLLRSNQVASALFYDVATEKLYLHEETVISQWDHPSAAKLSMTWASKTFHMPALRSYGAILIEGRALSGETLSVQVYADAGDTGVLSGTDTKTEADLNKPARLSGGFRAARWSFTVSGTAKVTAVSIAESVEELTRLR